MVGWNPNELQVIIEVSAHSPAIQYEVDNKTGALFVKRFLPTSMHFPCDYGYIPFTATLDNDFLRAIVITPLPVMRHCLMQCRPIGMLEINTADKIEHKIVVVPNDELTMHYDDVHSIKDLPSQLLDKIAHFFKHYQDSDSNNDVASTTWDYKEAAMKQLQSSMQRFEGNTIKLAQA